MITKEAKVWGQRWKVREDATHSSNILICKAGTRCSWHKHKHKANVFVLISGRILVITEYDDHLLETPGESLVIPPLISHEFQVLADSIVFEEMYVVYDDEDIEREIEGTILSPEHRKMLKELKGLEVSGSG